MAGHFTTLDAHMPASHLAHREHWHSWIGDVTIADAILDRLLQRTHRITFKGEESMRSPRARPATTHKAKPTAGEQGASA